MSDQDENNTEMTGIPQAGEETNEPLTKQPRDGAETPAEEPVEAGEDAVYAEDTENAPEWSEEEIVSENAEKAPDNEPEKPEEKKKKEKPAKSPRKVSLFAAVIAVLAASVLASQITFLSVRQSYHNKLASVSSNNYGNSKLAEVDELYRKYYVNEIDNEQLTDGIITGYIFGTGDKYGSYMTAEEYREYINSLNSRTEGIGASVIWNNDMDAIEVVKIYEDSPAEKAGVLVGDLIVEVDGVPVYELGFDAGVSAVKGEAGTSVKITVLRGEDYSETVQLEAVRSQINIKTVEYTKYGEAAVIAISNFYADTPTELKAAVSAAKADGCDRIVFDMRNNPGGYLNSVLSVLDFILPEGVIVRIKSASDEWTEKRSDASCLDMPMVVIVNGNTASAAELFTSALKDYGYATVIGTQTYGKGTVLTPYPLSDGSVVYISSDLYYPPKSDNFEGVGVTPDEVVELSEEAQKLNRYKLTYEDDNQLQRAVEIIKEK